MCRTNRWQWSWAEMMAFPTGISAKKPCSLSFQLRVRRAAESLKGGGRAYMDSHDGDGARRKSKNISGRCPTKPFKLGLWRLRHISLDCKWSGPVELGKEGEAGADLWIEALGDNSFGKINTGEALVSAVSARCLFSGGTSCTSSKLEGRVIC